MLKALFSLAMFLVAMELTTATHAISKSDFKSPRSEQTAQLDIDTGVTASYIDPAEERKVLWKFDLRRVLHSDPQ